MSDRENLAETLATGRMLQEKANKRVQDDKRIITLMEAGLKERPLDRDFFDRIKIEFEREAIQVKQGGEMLKMLEEIVSDIGSDE